MSEERQTGVTLEPETATHGVYVYCIIESESPRSFGPVGIGGRGDEVYTVHHRDLAAVVSRSPLLVYDPTRDNALTHEHVQEVVMNEHGFTPVPMSFGTMFKTEGDTVEFLSRPSPISPRPTFATSTIISATPPSPRGRARSSARR